MSFTSGEKNQGPIHKKKKTPKSPENPSPGRVGSLLSREGKPQNDDKEGKEARAVKWVSGEFLAEKKIRAEASWARSGFSRERKTSGRHHALKKGPIFPNKKR